MKISVVIPTYNSQSYLPTVLECISSQHHHDVEIIVVDNLSTDKTKQIVDLYSGILNIKWLSERDRGQGDAVTKGLSLATGDIIHWHAADDYILPNSFQTVQRIFESLPDTDLVYADGLASRDGESRLFSSWPTRGMTKQSMLSFFGRFQSDTAYWRKGITQHGVPLRDDIPLMVDEEFFVRLVAASRRITRSPTPLGVFRIRAGQISANKSGVDIAALRKEFRVASARLKTRPTDSMAAVIGLISHRLLSATDSALRAAQRSFGIDPYRLQHEYVSSIDRLALTRVRRLLDADAS